VKRPTLYGENIDPGGEIELGGHVLGQFERNRRSELFITLLDPVTDHPDERVKL